MSCATSKALRDFLGKSISTVLRGMRPSPLTPDMVSSASDWSNEEIRLDGLDEVSEDIAQPLHRGTVLIWNSDTDLVLKLVCELTSQSHSCLVIRSQEEFEYVLITEPLCAVIVDEKQSLDPTLQQNLAERVPMLLLGAKGAVTIPFLADWLANSPKRSEMIERLFASVRAFLHPTESPDLQIAYTAPVESLSWA